MVSLRVTGVALDKESDSTFVLLREIDGAAVLLIPVGPFEASSIIMEIECIKPIQLLTHDLLAEFFIRHGFQLDNFTLYGQETDIFLGRLDYRKGWHRYTMEVRPSDGIALALRLGAPIQAVQSLVESVAAPANKPPLSCFMSDSLLYLDTKDFEACL